MAYNANKHLRNFQHDRVYADKDTRETAQKRRKANRERLEKGLKDDDKALPQEFVEQGSYAMATMVRAVNEASDIDDGVVFKRSDLVGPNGGDKSPGDAKQMVCDALAKETKFKTPPEVRGNCVRIFYDDGFHVDMPVYRTWEENGKTYKQIASTNGDWKDSAPEDVTEWFRKQVADKSPETIGSRQMRRMVRLLKFWSKSRSSWCLPSGFVLSVLVDEAYQHKGWLDRDDQALLQIMRTIRSTRQWNQSVYRPVSPHEEITNDKTRPRVKNLCDELESAIAELSKLEDANCDELTALKALKKVFNTDYWDERIKELEDDGKGGGGGGGSDGNGGGKGTVPAEPKRPIEKKGGTGQYA